jgi:circadian clock protein KaiC
MAQNAGQLAYGNYPTERLTTGDAAFDRILGGGLPANSLTLVTGTPGAGKTIFAQQLSFAAARAGKRVIYFTHASEPHDKLLVHMAGFSFFDPSMVNEQVRVYNLSSQVVELGLNGALDFIVDAVRQERSDLLIIDSFRGLKHVLEPTASSRRAIFSFGSQLALLHCTCVLVGEYGPEELQLEPEFAVADGIISLRHAHEGAQERRTLRVIKQRGVGYLGGDHSFRIDHQGLQVFPRQEALSQAPSYSATQELLSSGVPDLDELLRGGLIRSSSTLILGAPGIGKTVLALHFLAAGAAAGEPGLFISFQENPEQLALRASHFGLLDELELESWREMILSLSPVELDVDAAAAAIREAVERRNVRRVVIDSVAELEHAVREPERYDDYLAALVGYLRGNDVTTIMTREITQLFGSDLTIASYGLSYIVDNIILLRYVEIEAAIRRALTVLKVRGSDHDKRLMELRFADGNVALSGQFAGLAGLMTGLPRSRT